MATVIKIKTSSTDAQPVSSGDSLLATGELAYSYATGAQNNNGDRLYLGVGTETAGISDEVVVIGGQYFTDMLDHVHGTLTASSGIIVDSNKKIDELRIDNLQLGVVDGNTFSVDQSSDANGDIKIIPGGTGDVIITAANLTVNGDTQITGDITVTGDETRTGDVAITGTLDVSGQTELGSLNVEDLTNNRIVIAGVDGELEDDANFRFDGTNFDIGAAGSEKFRVVVASGNTTIEGTADITGAVGIDGNFDIATNKFTVAAATGNTVIAGTLDVAGQAEVGSLNVEDLTAGRVTFAGADGELVDDANFTFDSATDKLDITGSLEVDNITLDANTIATTSGQLVIAPAAQTEVNFSNTSAIKVPVGNTTQRPGTPATGHIRYNTTTSQYEGYAGSSWNGLGGVIDTDQNTYVIAQITSSLTVPGTAADTLYFVTGGTMMASLDKTNGLRIDNEDATGYLQLVDRTIATSGGDLTIDVGNTGDATGGTLIVDGNLQVNGTTTTVNSTEITVDDPVFTLGGDTAPSSDDNLDRGIQFRWHNGTAAKTGFFGYDDSASRFVFAADATNTAEKFAWTTLGDVEFGNALLDSVTISSGNYTNNSVPYFDANGDMQFLEETSTGLGQYGTEGQVLQMNSSGVPFFGHIDGGTY